MQGKYKIHRGEQEREIPEGKETADVVTDTEILTTKTSLSTTVIYR
jgi:hypothetical protein